MYEVSPGRRHRRTSWRLWRGYHTYGRDIIRLAVASCKGEASVADKLHNHTNHVLVRQKPQQLAGEATVPDSVIGSCQVDKDGTGLLFRFECILNALREQSDVIHGGSSA